MPEVCADNSDFSIHIPAAVCCEYPAAVCQKNILLPNGYPYRHLNLQGLKAIQKKLPFPFP